MAQETEVYATLLLTDSYLPGALVLAHSLRDAGCTRKLAVLVTNDTVSVEVVSELNDVYDYVIPVARIRNATPANLDLMGRPDLHSAFTKIQLWNQTQFSKIVYIDADVVALRAPDELFQLEAAFSAAPDIGWPDLFNTGVMVLTPNVDEYNALSAMAASGTSFDGADQGLLNMYYKDKYNRIPFTYNVTPTSFYTYVPAYEYNKSNISMIHYIGASKPWISGRGASSYGASNSYSELANKWWTVYDRHYGKESTAAGSTKTANGSSFHLVQYFTRGEFNPTNNEQVPDYYATGLPYHAMAWDAARYPPPRNSRPEAWNLPSRTYNMSQDPSQFVPPQRYASPPRNLWYDVPNQTAPQQVFPWEAQQPKPSRVFLEHEPLNESHGANSASPVASPFESQPAANAAAPASPATTATTDVPGTPSSGAEPATPIGIADRPLLAAWDSYDRTNAWDEVPEIDRYVSDLQGGKNGGMAPPTAIDRPSLPATPAPVRSSGFGVASDEDGGFPAAHGVPDPSQWDPHAQLEKLVTQRDEMMRKLELSGGADAAQQQQFGSVLSPTPVKRDGANIVRNMSGPEDVE